MPKEKDLKRLVRARMQKTGESYTAARLQLLKKNQTTRRLATVAGMSDASVSKQTGRTWAEWVRLLDAADAAKKTHREIAARVSSLGTPSWWTQMVTVGYERIRGLRERGQQRSGGYQITKSRTFDVSIGRLFAAFTSGRLSRRWLPKGVTLRSMTANKRVRLGWADGTQVVVGFVSKGAAKAVAAVQHEKLPDRASADAMKKAWSGYLDTLGDLLA
jgi:hypothetical protein